MSLIGWGVLGFAATCFAIAFGVGILFIFVKTVSYEKKIQSNIELFEAYSIEQRYKNQFRVLNERAKWQMLNYTMFQTMGKGFETLAIVFSVCTLPLLFEPTPLPFPVIVSLLSITFVILTIYLTPTIRAKEYILGWRDIDGHINAILAKDPSDTGGMSKKFEEIPELILKMERSFHAEER